MMTKQQRRPVFDKCPYCHLSIVTETQIVPKPELTTDKIIEIVNGGCFAFLGYGTDEEISKRRSQEFYHCYRCKRSIVLAYDQFF